MAYQTNSSMSKDDWAKKEMRELYCKSINTLLMQGTELKKALESAKTIVDTAFKNYPDSVSGSGEKLENIIN